MTYGIKRILKYLLGTDIAGRDLAVYPDDTFIVSYPRSGNTWTRFLVANLVYPRQPVSFVNIERLIPDCEAQSSRYIKRIPRPRLIKSHEYFDCRYKKVIYIVRDPRDVALSYYHFSRKYRHIPDDCPIEAFVSDFVHGRLNSQTWGTWAENVGTWIAARQGSADFLLIRYEDLKARTEAELARVANFLGIAANPEQLRRAAELSSVDRMRELEKTQAEQWVSTKGKRSDIPFVGAATVGTWTLELPSAAVLEIESAWGSIMAYLSYQLTSGAPQSAFVPMAPIAVSTL